MAALRLHQPETPDPNRKLHAPLPVLTERTQLYDPSTLRALLACCGLRSAEWVLRRWQPEYVAMVCCKVIDLARRDEDCHPIKLALWLFKQSEPDVDMFDARPMVFPGLFGGRGGRPMAIKPASAPPSIRPAAMHRSTPAASILPASDRTSSASPPAKSTPLGSVRQQTLGDADGEWTAPKWTDPEEKAKVKRLLEQRQARNQGDKQQS